MDGKGYRETSQPKTQTGHQMSEPAARDPRTDPKVGDILSRDGLAREVLRIIPCGHHWDVEYYSPTRQRIGKCWRFTWKRWANNAEVIHAACQ